MKYVIDLKSFDSLTYNGKGTLGNQVVQIHKTFAFGERLSFFDVTNTCWIYDDEIENIVY